MHEILAGVGAVVVAFGAVVVICLALYGLATIIDERSNRRW